MGAQGSEPRINLLFGSAALISRREGGVQILFIKKKKRKKLFLEMRSAAGAS